jgi:hypothetical protein
VPTPPPPEQQGRAPWPRSTDHFFISVRFHGYRVLNVPLDFSA